MVQLTVNEQWFIYIGLGYTGLVNEVEDSVTICPPGNMIQWDVRRSDAIYI